MLHIRRRQLYDQFETYLAWRERTYPSAATRDRSWITMFAEVNTELHDINDVRVRHLVTFADHVRGEFLSVYIYKSAMRSVCNLLGYYHRRGAICPNRSTWKKIKSTI